ncbi:unnamed protein product [Cyclocybe aegerita]|uniref:Microbial-type PARG catalytic domain-containing protein n=1 Tax=Cyclocybe aegerita TaxID=1973307 RepID=A0A8S0WWM8_CYCAE|nr:unnamed protein product [Cyclocybe aegerita]
MDGRDPPRSYPHRQPDPRRAHLQQVAATTIAAINNGYVDVCDHVLRQTARYDIRRDVDKMQQRTRFYPDNARELVDWRKSPQPPTAPTPTHVSALELSTLEGARYLSTVHSRGRIGVLNFASATKPGGGFLNGAQAQEESLARSSTLFASLQSDTAQPFYALHDHDDKGGYYTHAMVYTPGVTLFRLDNGEWAQPIKVDVLTSPAVNAGQVRKLRRRSRNETEGRIREVMKERMGRILALFESKGMQHIVLGSFGTGVFQNDVREMAKIWQELLLAPNARFMTSFETVLFTIPDKRTRQKFESSFFPSHAAST